jgi:AcrR family transcriptional regulator
MSSMPDEPSGRASPPSRIAQILDAAASVFARRGFEEARVDDVAAEAGLAKGTVYLYFRSKDALIEALVGRVVEVELRRLRDVRATGASVPDRLTRFVHDYTSELERMAPLAPMFLQVYARATRHASVRRALTAYMETYVVEIAVLLEEGVRRGEIRTSDPRAAALHLGALLEGIALLWLVNPEAVPLVATADAALETMLRGLAAPAGAGPAEQGG